MNIVCRSHPSLPCDIFRCPSPELPWLNGSRLHGTNSPACRPPRPVATYGYRSPSPATLSRCCSCAFICCPQIAAVRSSRRFDICKPFQYPAQRLCAAASAAQQTAPVRLTCLSSLSLPSSVQLTLWCYLDCYRNCGTGTMIGGEPGCSCDDGCEANKQTKPTNN